MESSPKVTRVSNALRLTQIAKQFEGKKTITISEETRNSKSGLCKYAISICKVNTDNHFGIIIV